MKKAIVSFANSNGYYMQRLARLSDSLRDNFDGDFLAFVHESSLGAPFHKDNPYAFKIYAIQKAIDAGYTQIVWLDSSVYAVAPVQPIFNRLNKNGMVFQEAGHMLGTWTNDSCLDYFGLTRDASMKIPMIGNAGFLGINTDSDLANEFFTSWKICMDRGFFKGEWNNDKGTESLDRRCKGHRHDMSCSSAIVNSLGLFNLAYKSNEALQYAGIYDKTLNESIIFKAQG